MAFYLCSKKVLLKFFHRKIVDWLKLRWKVWAVLKFLGFWEHFERISHTIWESLPYIFHNKIFCSSSMFCRFKYIVILSSNFHFFLRYGADFSMLLWNNNANIRYIFWSCRHMWLFALLYWLLVLFCFLSVNIHVTVLF